MALTITITIGSPVKLVAALTYMRKTLVALVGAEIGWATLSLQHGFGAVTFDQWIAQAVLVAMACGVYVAPNSSKTAPATLAAPVASTYGTYPGGTYSVNLTPTAPTAPPTSRRKPTPNGDVPA